jgi:cell wall-associated NlpC family hydrolase
MMFRLAMVLLAVGTGACASSGTVPRPRPFPGAELPPVATSEPDARPAADAASDETVPAVTVSAMLATALELRGTPYRNGGSDPSGFDCSGFVQWVFAQHGTRLPREVKDQFGAGSLIDRDEVKAGDLVFFQTVTQGPSHVGIALGNGEFVHAPSSRGVVRVEKYTSGYWDQRWLGARRPY